MKPAPATNSIHTLPSLSTLEALGTLRSASTLGSAGGGAGAVGAGAAKAPPQSPSPVASQLPRGRLVEFAAGYTHCPVTQAVACLRYAQHQGETCAWLQREGGSLFPPDLADSGIDLEALVVVHVPQTERAKATTASPLQKAAEVLLRSGGFGMLVLDLWDFPSQGHAGHGGLTAGSTAWQGRLLGLAREHHCWVILLSPPNAQGSLGPLINIRLASIRSASTRLANQRKPPNADLKPNTKAANQQTVQQPSTQASHGQFVLQHEVLKDKSATLGALTTEPRRGPWGLL